MALVDQYGNPLRREELLQEQASATMTGVRSIFTNNTTYGLNPSKLGRILRAADDGDIESYLEMAEELEEKDTHYISVIGTRKRAVSKMEITVEAASDDANDAECADLVRSWIDRDELRGELIDILDAIGKGFSATEIMWDTSESLWMPKDLIRRDPRWFEFDRATGETLMLRTGGQPEPLAPYKFIVHKHKAKSGLPVRGGVARPCAWMWLFKNFSIKDWVIFAEAYGQPIRVGKYGAGASKEDRDVLLRAVANIGSDAAAIIPESMMIEFVEAQGKTATADVFERLCNFCDQQISKAVLGQTTTTDAISGGHAVSQEHNDVRGDIAEADAVQLAMTLNKQLVIPLVTLNRGPQKRYPRIRIRDPEDIDVEKITNAADKAVRFGMKISERRLRDMVGLPEPEDEEDVLRVPAGTAPPEATGPDRQDQAQAAAQRKASGADAIDDLSGQMADDWEQMLNPLTAMIETALTASGSYDEFRQKLLDLAADLDMVPAAEKIARALFAARVAGNLDVKLD